MTRPSCPLFVLLSDICRRSQWRRSQSRQSAPFEHGEGRF